MGYYIDLVFDLDEPYNYKALVKRFCMAGARKDLYPLEESHVPELSYQKLLIALCGDEAEIKKGFWASIRISWGTELAHFRETMKVILGLAKKVGCQVYDGQHDRYLTLDNLDVEVKGFEKDAKWAIGLIGTIDTKE